MSCILHAYCDKSHTAVDGNVLVPAGRAHVQTVNVTPVEVLGQLMFMHERDCHVVEVVLLLRAQGPLRALLPVACLANI